MTTETVRSTSPDVDSMDHVPAYASFVGWIARHPVWSIVVALVVAFGLAAGGQPPTSNEGGDLAPDAAALQTAERIDELFPDRSTTTALQVLVDVPEGVLSPAGVDDITAVTELVEASLGDRLAETGVLSPLDPLLAAPPGAPADAAPGQLPDDAAGVAAAWEQSVDRLPPAVGDRLLGLFPVDVAPAEAESALVLVLLEEGSGDGLLEAEAAFAEDLAELDVEAAAFSPNLVSAQDLGVEVLALLGVAVLVILLILVVLSFPRGRMSRLARLRRGLADALTTVLVALLAVQAANGFAAWLGPDGLGWLGAQTGPSQAIPILLIGLAVDYVIHFNREYRDDLHDGTPARPSTAIALEGVRRALVLSGITTILGFLTNTLSGIRGLIDFGVVAAFGIAMALLFTFLLFPSIRQLLDRLAERRGRDLEHGLDLDREGRLARGIGSLAGLTARPVATVAVAVALTVGAGFAATGLTVEFSFLDFVPTDSPLRSTAERLDASFDGGGGETVRILVEGDVTDPAVHDALVSADAELDDVDDLQSAGDRAQVDGAVRRLQALVAGPDADPAVAAVVASELGDDLRATPGADLDAVWQAALAADPDLSTLLSLDPPATVVEAVAGDIEDAGAFAAELDAALAPVVAAGAETGATSRTLNDAAIVDRLSEIQVQSLVLAVLAALLVLTLAYWRTDRRPLVGVVTVVPVAMTVVILFGVMALLGIPFTPVTATIAALAIGIGVDYAIHLSSRFLRERSRDHAIGQAVHESLTMTGSALAASGLTTAAGFAVLTFSSLIPFQQLGQVTLISIVVAVAMTTMLLPSLLVLVERRRS